MVSSLRAGGPKDAVRTSEESAGLGPDPVHKVLESMIKEVAALNHRVDKLLSHRQLILGDRGRNSWQIGHPG